MAIGKRIKLFRKRKGMTQKEFGMQCGFPESQADVRIAQYEKEARIPKAELVEKMAEVLEVSPQALRVPDIDTPVGLMHTFFALEDLYGVKVLAGQDKKQICLGFDAEKMPIALHQMLCVWAEKYEQYRNGEISREEYDEWRYKLDL